MLCGASASPVDRDVAHEQRAVRGVEHEREALLVGRHRELGLFRAAGQVERVRVVEAAQLQIAGMDHVIEAAGIDQRARGGVARTAVAAGPRHRSARTTGS